MKTRTTGKATGAKYYAEYNHRKYLVKMGLASWLPHKCYGAAEACDRAGIP